MSRMKPEQFDKWAVSLGSVPVSAGLPNTVPGLTPETSVNIFLILLVYRFIRGFFYD